MISALIIPAFLLFVALALDVGTWYTHKRALQNRVDAGALAAGVEYVRQLANCSNADPAVANAAAIAIGNQAKLYAGAAPDDYNRTVTTGPVTVKINALSFGDADDTAGDPCETLWTDVVAQETGIGTLAGAFGVSLASITARARVEVKQLTGVRNRGLPFVLESGDYVDCVWARFVNARTGELVSLVGGPNPVSLAPDPVVRRRWTAAVGGIALPNGEDDVAVEYSMGAATGGECNFSTLLKNRIPGSGTSDNGSGGAVVLNWINVFDDDNAGGQSPPLLHHFSLRPGTCGPDTVAFVYSPDACTLTFSAEVEHGTNPAPYSVTVSSSNAEVAPVEALATSSSGTETTYVNQISFDPNEVASVSPAQNYSEVGQHLLKASWTMTAGTLTSGKLTDGTDCTVVPCICTAGSPCVGAFDTELAGNTLHATYVADPVNSVPLVSAELLSGTVPLFNSIAADGGPVGPFQIVVTNVGVDEGHIVLVRGSAQGTGSRSVAVDCGQATGASNCAQSVTVNQRGNGCSPPPLPGGIWDCVLSGQSSIPLAARFATPCTPNNWNSSSPGNLNPSDPRFAYVFLTSLGRVQAGQSWLPVKSFARFYVTGGDGFACSGDDPEPRGTGSSQELWGHLVDVVTLDDDVIVSDGSCDLETSIVTCKPTLVR